MFIDLYQLSIHMHVKIMYIFLIKICTKTSMKLIQTLLLRAVMRYSFTSCCWFQAALHKLSSHNLRFSLVCRWMEWRGNSTRHVRRRRRRFATRRDEKWIEFLSCTCALETERLRHSASSSQRTEDMESISSDDNPRWLLLGRLSAVCANTTPPGVNWSIWKRICTKRLQCINKDYSLYASEESLLYKVLSFLSLRESSPSKTTLIRRRWLYFVRHRIFVQ
jgi:hypothetical protein